jgi:hypothetical protein
MTPLLFVVSRAEPERYEYLRRAFAREEAVEVVFDRREGERRQIRRSPSVERRRRDRRARDIGHELERLGYALVRR